jgi:hypothetical protein
MKTKNPVLMILWVASITGGLVGVNSGIIENCIAFGNITKGYGATVGVLVGDNIGKIYKNNSKVLIQITK